MRMLEPCGELDLAAEAVLVDAGRHLGRQDLDHHLPRQLYVLGQEDPAHSATAEFTLDAEVRSQCFREPLCEVGQRSCSGKRGPKLRDTTGKPPESLGCAARRHALLTRDEHVPNNWPGASGHGVDDLKTQIA